MLRGAIAEVRSDVVSSLRTLSAHRVSAMIAQAGAQLDGSIDVRSTTPPPDIGVLNAKLINMLRAAKGRVSAAHTAKHLFTLLRDDRDTELQHQAIVRMLGSYVPDRIDDAIRAVESCRDRFPEDARDAVRNAEKAGTSVIDMVDVWRSHAERYCKRNRVADAMRMNPLTVEFS